MKNFPALAVASVLFVCFAAASAAAQTSNCSEALIKSVYKKKDKESRDWRLSRLVTKGVYEEAKKDEGAGGSLFGVTLGASYDDYQKRSEQDYEKTDISLDEEQLHNIAWTGLDPNSVTAYSKCLDAEVFATDGLHAAVQYATEQDVTILVRWHRTASAKPLRVAWQPDTFLGVKLPTQINDGLYTIRIARPQKAIQLVANGGGYTTGGIVITPMSIPPVFTCVKGLPLSVRDDTSQTNNFTEYYAYGDGDPWRYTLKRERWGLSDSDQLVDVDPVPNQLATISIKAQILNGEVQLEPRSRGGGTRANFSLALKYKTTQPCP